MYVEIAKGAIQNRGAVVNTALLIEAAKGFNGEMYNSYYQFDEEIIEHFKIRKTIRGYRGKYYLPHPLIDIDKGTDSDSYVLDKVKYLLDRLKDDFSVYPEQCNIFFSGRGYHVVLPDIFKFQPHNNLPSLVKNTLEKYLPEGDSIYDGARLIRTPYSLNTKSNLFKIPLTSDELFSLEAMDIHTLAKERRTIEPIDTDDYTIPDHSGLVQLEIENIPVENESVESSNIVTCVQKMFAEGPIEGSRHEKMLRMVTSWRRGGIPRQGIIAMLTTWANNLEPYEIKRVVDDTFDKGYHPYKCSDKIMTKYCDAKCIFYKSKNYTTEIVSAQDSEKEFARFVNSNLDKAFDLNELYQCASYKFYPGEVVMVIGDTKLGKSTIVQNWCVALKDKKILYLPLENAMNLSYRRFVQMAHGMTKEQVFNHYKGNDNETLSTPLHHIYTVSLPPTMNDLKKMIMQHKPDIVVIDTIDGIDTPGIYDGTQKTEILGTSIKEMAQQLDVIIFVIVHISKSAAQDVNGKNKAMNVHSNKGSSNLPQKFDKILAWEGNREERQRILTSLAARDEENIKLSFQFEWETFRMKQLGV